MWPIDRSTVIHKGKADFDVPKARNTEIGVGSLNREYDGERFYYKTPLTLRHMELTRALLVMSIPLRPRR